MNLRPREITARLAAMKKQYARKHDQSKASGLGDGSQQIGISVGAFRDGFTNLING